MERALTYEGHDDVSSDENARADAVARLFDVHHARLYRLALRMTWGSDDARDLVQECFLRAIERRPVPLDEATAERWLVRVLVNLCRDRARRGAVRQAHAAAVSAEPAAGPGDPAMSAALRTAMTSLPARQRAVVVLHELEGRPLVEVAGLLGIAAVTARWHLHTALGRLRKELTR